jgi:hypothetical protein
MLERARVEVEYAPLYPALGTTVCLGLGGRTNPSRSHTNL